jgi:RecA-family ATPase
MSANASPNQQTGPNVGPKLLDVTWDGSEKLEFPLHLVKEMVTEATIGYMAGESRAGKTFLAINLSFCCALGLPFFGRKMRKGGVLYVAAEAPGTILGRMEAARKNPQFKNEKADSLPIAKIFDIPNLADESGIRH